MNSTSSKIIALLGPTNTGKTYVAIEKMLEFKSGIFGFPLRLLAREVYDKCVDKVGEEKVALITDGRMSGASGKVPSAIHVTPEAIDGGTISKIQDGDKIEIDANTGTLNLNENYSNRKISKLEKDLNVGFGRNLFSLLRKNAISAESGAGLNLIND